MAMTLLESAKYSDDDFESAIKVLITERSPVLQYLPFETIDGNAYTYNQEQVLPGISFRGVNETYPRSTGVINPVTERLVIMGGEVFIDNFQLRTQSNIIDLKMTQWKMKARALAMTFSEYFFEGDSTSNVRVFDGLRPRLTGGQLVTAGVNGAALTLPMMDNLLDALIGDGEDSHLFMNKTNRQSLLTLGRNVTGGFTYLDTGNDAFGKKIVTFGGVPIHIVERDDTAATFLGFDETVGSSNITSSIYIVRFGDDMVQGIQGAGGSMEVKDLGEDFSAPGRVGRIEWYPGLCVRHPRAAARLRGVL